MSKVLQTSIHRTGHLLEDQVEGSCSPECACSGPQGSPVNSSHVVAAQQSGIVVQKGPNMSEQDLGLYSPTFIWRAAHPWDSQLSPKLDAMEPATLGWKGGTCRSPLGEKRAARACLLGCPRFWERCRARLRGISAKKQNKRTRL